MKRFLLLLNFIIIFVLGYFALKPAFFEKEVMSGAPPYGASESEIPDLDPLNWFANWKRPEGPPRVGLQIGHLENAGVPDELDNLLGNTGATGGGKSEAEVNASIAEETKKILEARGIVVDVLPTTVPPSYIADAFIAIHADGNENRNINGYKVAGPWRDWSNKSSKLASILDETYPASTSMPKDDNISNNMRGYYAFSWWRYRLSIHPMTPGVIVETGFLTSPIDQAILIGNPQISAKGIADGVIRFLQEEGLVE